MHLKSNIFKNKRICL